jgi:sialic acid synthase SpsE
MSARKPFIVAELSANHLGDKHRALALVEVAKAAGADAVKVQVWSPDTMVLDRSIPAPKPWTGTLFDLYREAWTPWEWLPDLFKLARHNGLVPFGAAFDAESVDYLETLHVDRHKVASFELTDLPLIRYMASKGKPMILSTGMASAREIGEAYRCLPAGLETTTLKCTSAYPADAADANLAAGMRWPRWGLSDHTLGLGVAVAATVLGATMIEKHLTLKRSDGGPDAAFSMEPAEFAQMVSECRRAAAAIGEVKYGPGPHESTAMRRSLWVTRDTHIGSPLVFGENVRTARPGLGLAPSFDLKGRTAARTLLANTPLTEDCIA